MPSSIFRHISDEDDADIVAYLRAQPAIEPDTPSTRFNLLGAMMINFLPLLRQRFSSPDK